MITRTEKGAEPKPDGCTLTVRDVKVPAGQTLIVSIADDARIRLFRKRIVEGERVAIKDMTLMQEIPRP